MNTFQQDHYNSSVNKCHINSLPRKHISISIPFPFIQLCSPCCISTESHGYESTKLNLGSTMLKRLALGRIQQSQPWWYMARGITLPVANLPIYYIISYLIKKFCDQGRAITCCCLLLLVTLSLLWYLLSLAVTLLLAVNFHFAVSCCLSLLLADTCCYFLFLGVTCCYLSRFCYFLLLFDTCWYLLVLPVTCCYMLFLAVNYCNLLRCCYLLIIALTCCYLMLLADNSLYLLVFCCYLPRCSHVLKLANTCWYLLLLVVTFVIF